MSERVVVRQESKGVYGWKGISLGGKRGSLAGVLKMNKDGIAWRSKGGQSVAIVGNELSGVEWICSRGNIFQLRCVMENGTVYKFDGFSKEEQTFFPDFFKASFDVEVKELVLNTKGANWGSVEVSGKELSFAHKEQTCFEIPLGDVTKAALSMRKDDVNLEFTQDDTISSGSHSLVEIKFHSAKPNTEGAIRAKEKAHSLLQDILGQMDQSSVVMKDALVTFEEIPILVPRGKFQIELFAQSMRFMGKTVHDYKINYSSVVRLFQLPRPDRASMLFVVSLDPPIRQGHTTYPHLVMQIPEADETTISVKVPKEGGSDKIEALQKIGTGPTFQQLARVFKLMTGKKITIPRTFKTDNEARAIKCSLKANDGYLYPLEQSFFFVHKPPTHLRFEEIKSVEYLRVSSDQANRTFDLKVFMKGDTHVTLKGIVKEHFSALSQFIARKKLRVSNLDMVEVPIGRDSDSEGEESRRGGARGGREIIREKIRQQMAVTQVDSEESDEDFAGDSSDDSLDSDEIDSASDVEDHKSSSKKAKKETKAETPEEAPASKKRSRRGETPTEELQALPSEGSFDEPSHDGADSSSDEEEEGPPTKKRKVSEKEEKKEEPAANSDDEDADFDM
eukprot:TRINITY_DN177_c3_g1_i2.p1 TRINITY_DN177_c3_g1~~TRINITY_DN177_c3_g1_i2.p1  ORF type:complete len:620 (+),score=172.17 TRINITY_DN177_c3_g1_i2:121-1980(+)